MAKENKKVKPKKDPTLEEIEEKDLGLQSQTMEAQMKKDLDPETQKKVKHIAYYLSRVGLSLEESCLLVDVDIEWFKQLMVTTPIVRRVIEIKKMQFKKDLLKVLTQRGIEGDDKLAQWLLERQYPEEFGNKKRGGKDPGEDILFEAIEFIQKSGDNNPLVKETSGRAIVVKRIQTQTPGDNLQKSEAVKTLEKLLT